MAKIEPAGRLRDKAYESFIEHLLASDIHPGQFLSQRELVAVTGMPLGAIRELIPRLEVDRLIETVPQRGMQVAMIDLKLVRDVFQVWKVIEKSAAESFAATASDEHIEALAKAHRNLLEQARGQGDRDFLEDARRIEWMLHDAFMKALDNEILSEVYRVNSVKVQLIKMQRGLLNGPAILVSIEERLAIIEALMTRDARSVVAAVEAHLEASLRRAMGL